MIKRLSRFGSQPSRPNEEPTPANQEDKSSFDGDAINPRPTTESFDKIHPDQVKHSATRLPDLIVGLQNSLLEDSETKADGLEALSAQYQLDKQSLEEVMAQNETQHYPLISHTQAFVSALKKLISVSEERQTKIVLIYESLREGFWQLGDYTRAPKTKRSEDIVRIDQVKTLIDLYSAKIKLLRDSTELNESNKIDSVEYLKRLRERDIALLEGEA